MRLPSILTALILLPVLSTGVQAAQDVSYAKQVHPILERHCFKCHGAEKQKGDLRFDTRAGLFTEQDGYTPVVPGDLEMSLLLELVSLPADDLDVMPPEGETLNERELAVLRSWIEQGAAWESVAKKAERADPLLLPELSVEQQGARTAAFARLSDAGFAAQVIVKGRHALEFNGSLVGAAFADEQAAWLVPLAPSLVWVNLSGTGITDAGAAHLGRLSQVQRLNLSRTKVSDAALGQLKGLANLESLNLYSTGTTDAGLAQLVGLKKLRKLYLWQTSVSDAGVLALQQALPKLVINRGVLPPEPEPEPETPEPETPELNANCPVSGAAVDAAHTSQFEDAPVAFCCEKCKAKFDADPAAFADAVRALRK
ncbi:MAG: YHS domain-containing protein [Planctomycetota bacterium]|jgi:YHS domain-containing protein